MNQTNNLRARVLVSPAYQEKCKILFELFRLSREINRDPMEVLDFQVGLARMLAHFQEKKAEFKQEGNNMGVAAMKRLILNLNRIADALVWRLLEYNRIFVQLVSGHSKTGYLDVTIFGDLEAAQRIVAQKGAIVIVNDLTSILRHGDLTIIDRDNVSLLETKHGKAGTHDRRATRQRRHLQELQGFMNTGVRISEDRRDFIIRVDVPIRTYHPVVIEVIKEAKSKGYCRIDASNIVAIEAVYLKHKDGEFPPSRPFDRVDHTIQFDNHQCFFKPITRVAPYGIFPLDHQSCYDLITGEILLATTINLDQLQSLYKQFEIRFELPQLTKQEIISYLTAPIAERKRYLEMARAKYTLTDIDRQLPLNITPDWFGRIGLELIHERTLVQEHQQFIKLVKDLEMGNKGVTRFYVGYRDENKVWF